MINFISHENFPDDPYIKEIVYLQVNQDARYGYIRKNTKNGNMFWSPMGCGVMKNGEKKFFDGIELDSNFLKKDILAFLESRSWESSKVAMGRHDFPTSNVSTQYPKDPNVQMTHYDKEEQSKAALHQKYENSPAPAAQMSFLDDCPF